MEITKYMDTLEQYDFAEEFAGYDSGVISEIISEIADNSISCNTRLLIQHALENEELAGYVVFEGLVSNPNEYENLKEYVSSVGAAVWSEENQQAMHDNLDECVLYSVCSALKFQYGVSELSDEQIEELECLIFDTGCRLEDVIEEAAYALDLCEDEDEE